MGKISISLARIERVKIILECWQQKKNISNIERSIVLNQLSALYDDLLDIGISNGKVATLIPSETMTPGEEDSCINTADVVVDKKEEDIEKRQTAAALEVEKTVKKKEDITKSEVSKQELNVTIRLGDKFNGLHKYLFENFDSQDDTGSARFSAIEDINRAIGINDRFLFIKELFNGDKDLFNKTISALNSSNSIDDALMHIHENFDWNSEDPAVKQLVLLLYRRFK